ncbi:C-type isolectin Sp-CL4-like [Clinocottus analis]|uniref:C-type isolectin Sp-CL4-like n=1 Tax=Clinocottus analis TaxID=304258 RepID=UPI0035C0E55E
MRPAVFTAVLLLVGIISTVTALSTAPPVETCAQLKESECDEPGWIRFGGSRCMKYFRTPKSFHQALECCHCMDSELLSVHNEEENNNAMCMSYYYRNPIHAVSFWIGAHRVGGALKYLDGTEFKYGKWRTRQPDNYRGREGCVEINAGKEWGKWNDYLCYVKRDFVCVKRK